MAFINVLVLNFSSNTPG